MGARQTTVGATILPGLLTVAGLPTPGADTLGSYARVNDLFGEKTDLVLCSMVGSSYFWQPVRPFWAKSIAGDTSMTLSPLKSPSLVRLTGTLSAARTVTLDPMMAWPGCEFEIAMDGALSIFSLTIAGLALGATLAVLAGGRKRVYWDGTAYQTF